MRLLRTSLCLSLLALGAGGAAYAEPVLWLLPETAVQPCCGGSEDLQGKVSGNFLYDPVTYTLLDWQFEVSGFKGIGTLVNGSANPATGMVWFSSPSSFVVSYQQEDAVLMVSTGYWTTFPMQFNYLPIPPSGVNVSGNITVVGYPPSFASFNSSGTFFISSVPEPVTGLLVLAGAAALCLWKPGRFRRRSSDRA